MSKKLYDSFNLEEIKELYLVQRFPVSKIASKFNVSHKTMKKFFNTNGINVFGRVSSNKFLRDKGWLEDQYVSKGISIQKIADFVGSTRGNVHSALRFAKIKIRGVAEGIKVSQPNRFGKNASNWRGGKRTTGQNSRYYQILNRSHPNATPDGYVLEHRLVMEKKIGRYLTKEDIVHHIDGDGHNNDISNLKLTTRKEHFKDHFDGVKLVKPLQGEVARLKLILDSHKILY